MESLEEGQILQEDQEPLQQRYAPEYEWPGDDDLDQDTETSSKFTQTLRAGQPIFRLVVLRSSILSKQKKVAVIDSYPEVQLGRDVQVEGSTIPRIRLKEMQVSKVHATLFWDGARKEWDVVDMGSMHGTFLLPGPVNPDLKSIGSRLSLSRAASIPRRLRHCDQLTLGSTTFEVHIHDDQRPCLECSVTGSEEIPLFPLPKKTSVKRTRDVAGIDSEGSSASSSGSTNAEKDPKKALSMLKRSLLTRHDSSQHGSTPTVAASKTNEYVDRAARRRLLHPSSRPESPGMPPVIVPKAPSTVPASGKHTPEPVVSQPPAPLPSSNIGHRLLMQQGWEPGSSLGTKEDVLDGRTALVEPLEVKTSQNRTGLGMKPSEAVDASLPASGLSWKEREKFKRFGSIK